MTHIQGIVRYLNFKRQTEREADDKRQAKNRYHDSHRKPEENVYGELLALGKEYDDAD